MEHIGLAFQNGREGIARHVPIGCGGNRNTAFGLRINGGNRDRFCIAAMAIQQHGALEARPRC